MKTVKTEKTEANPVIEAIAAIRKVGTIDELLAVNIAVRERWNFLQYQATTAFHIGDRVRFRTKTGRAVVGTIERINRKSISVSSDNPAELGWRVSPNILQRQEGQ